MMNDTVARIVEIMFQDTEMTDEVAAIRDEVMNNCQERYEDMRARGLSEDDAVAAVIESLKGMEEVIAQYPKKAGSARVEADAFEVPEDELCGEYTFHHGSVQSIDLTLVCEDVQVEQSPDWDVHVTVEGDDPRAVALKLNGGKLRIERTPDYQREVREEHVFTARNGRMEVDGASIETESVSGFESLGRIIGEALKRIKVSVNSMGSPVESVTIAVPEGWRGSINLMTTSGDVHVDHVSCGELRAVTTNGDISVEMEEAVHLPKAEIISTSGDVEATIFADLAILRTTSGDIDLEGRSHTLNVSTISGDIDVRADAVECIFKAISGDVDLDFDSAELRSVNGSTISGDVEIDLPDGIGSVGIQTHTLSGDVCTRCHTNGYGPCVAGSITTTSGDITIS